MAFHDNAIVIFKMLLILGLPSFTYYYSWYASSHFTFHHDASTYSHFATLPLVGAYLLFTRMKYFILYHIAPRWYSHFDFSNRLIFDAFILARPRLIKIVLLAGRSTARSRLGMPRKRCLRCRCLSAAWPLHLVMKMLLFRWYHTRPLQYFLFSAALCHYLLI